MGLPCNVAETSAASPAMCEEHLGVERALATFLRVSAAALKDSSSSDELFVKTGAVCRDRC